MRTAQDGPGGESSSTIRRWHGRTHGAARCSQSLRRRSRSRCRGAGAWWHPPARPSFYWQLQGKLVQSVPASVYDVDGFENTAAEVTALHADGRRVVCYVDVGTAENFRPDYSSFPKSVLGRSNGWPGERWLDIRRTDVIEPIMAARFRMCAEKGFDAVEPDNIEAFTNKSGFPITAADQLRITSGWPGGARAWHGRAAEERRRTDAAAKKTTSTAR